MTCVCIEFSAVNLRMICPDLEGFTGLIEIGSITMDVSTTHTPTGEHVMGKMDTNIKDSLDHVRAATQELHSAISDAVAKRGGATKADLEALAQKAKAATESAKGSLGTQHEAAKKHLADAVTHLETTQKQIAESLKSSGQAFQTSVQKALADARASAQKVSEAVAAKRSAASTKNPK
jgi:F0F1-type ATP synthase membrane subunit b/b'